MRNTTTQRDTTARVVANVRAELARAGVRQVDLYTAIGMTPGTFHRRITGRHPFSIDELDAIAAHLNVGLDTLIDTRKQVAA